MVETIKKYIPYAAIIFAVFFIVPLIFISDAMQPFFGIAYYVILPFVAAACAAVYCSKYGMDFLFTLIAPVVYLPCMFIYNGGFSVTNVILLVTYLFAGILGLFLGDIVLGDKRHAKEEEEKAEAEKMLLEAKRRDEKNKEKFMSKKEADIIIADDDDFDYCKYVSDIDKTPVSSTEDEIDAILGEYGSSRRR